MKYMIMNEGDQWYEGLKEVEGLGSFPVFTDKVRKGYWTSSETEADKTCQYLNAAFPKYRVVQTPRPDVERREPREGIKYIIMRYGKFTLEGDIVMPNRYFVKFDEDGWLKTSKKYKNAKRFDTEFDAEQVLSDVNAAADFTYRVEEVKE